MFVLQDWLEDVSWKKQTVLLCALRGPDSGGSPQVKAMVRWMRRTVLRNAAPHKTFMREEEFPSILEEAERNPLVFDMLPVHFFGHLMHAFQVIAEDHPDEEVMTRANRAYHELCEFLHIEPESSAAYHHRLRDELEEADYATPETKVA